MSKGARKWVEIGVFVAVMAPCDAGVWALYKVAGISTSGSGPGGFAVMLSAIFAIAAQRAVRRRLQRRYAPEELVANRL